MMMPAFRSGARAAAAAARSATLESEVTLDGRPVARGVATTSRYAADHARDPRRVILGSENNHQYANWAVVRHNPNVAGQFLWTGVDYLGEAGVFPNRANGAGLRRR